MNSHELAPQTTLELVQSTKVQIVPPSKHAAGRVGKKRPKRRNRRKP